MLRPRPHRVGKAESLFVENLKPFSTASTTSRHSLPILGRLLKEPTFVVVADRVADGQADLLVAIKILRGIPASVRRDASDGNQCDARSPGDASGTASAYELNVQFSGSLTGSLEMSFHHRANRYRSRLTRNALASRVCASVLIACGNRSAIRLLYSDGIKR